MSPQPSNAVEPLATHEQPVPSNIPGVPNRRISKITITLITVAVAVVLLGTAGAALTFMVQQRAAQEQAHEAALVERGEAFRLDAQRCGIDSGSYERLDGGEAIQFSRVTKYNGASYDAVWCFLERQGAAESLNVKIGQTRSLDGTREESWGDLLATWTYHPDAGLNILIERTDEPPVLE